MTTNMNYDEIFPSKWLRASDLPDDGKPKGFSVNGLTFEEIGQEKERKLVLHFHETTKLLVLNKTNATTLVNMVGKDLNQILGKKIGLYSTPVTFAGKTIMGVRVYPRLSSDKQPAPTQLLSNAPIPPEEPPDDDPVNIFEQDDPIDY